MPYKSSQNVFQSTRLVVARMGVNDVIACWFSQHLHKCLWVQRKVCPHALASVTTLSDTETLMVRFHPCRQMMK